MGLYSVDMMVLLWMDRALQRLTCRHRWTSLFVMIQTHFVQLKTTGENDPQPQSHRRVKPVSHTRSGSLKLHFASVTFSLTKF